MTLLKKNIGLVTAIMFAFALMMMDSCKKNEITIPSTGAHFIDTTGAYFITGPNVTFKIPVGLTTVSNVDRTIKVSVTSPTGAVQGTHYTLTTNTITIPAGKVVDSIEVKGVYSQYTTGRKDTLIFTIQDNGTDVKPTGFANTYKLVMRGPCFEGNVNLSDFLGDYNNTMETAGTSTYGPYQTKVVSVTSTGPTTGKVVISNVDDAGWNNLEFTLDWTDPNNRKVTLVPQNTGYDAGNLNSAYTGYPLEARPLAGGVTGTFSACSQTITLKFRLCFSLGCFNLVFTEVLAR